MTEAKRILTGNTPSGEKFPGDAKPAVDWPSLVGQNIIYTIANMGQPIREGVVRKISPIGLYVRIAEAYEGAKGAWYLATSVEVLDILT